MFSFSLFETQFNIKNDRVFLIDHHKYKMAFLKREERTISPLELRIKIENSVIKGEEDKKEMLLCKFCRLRKFMLE